MELLTGKTIKTGTTVGQVFKCSTKSVTKKRTVSDILAEQERLDAALSELRIAMRRDSSIADACARDILNAQLCMLNDFDYQSSLHKFIKKNKVCAEYAVSACTSDYAKELAALESEYLQVRAEDLINVGDNLIETLTGKHSQMQLAEPGILVAEDFTPAQLSALNKKFVLGLVSRRGSTASHTAILANNYGIPYIADIDIDKITDGSTIIIDGEKNRVVLNPDFFSVAFVKGKMAETKKTPECAFADTKMKIFANISSLEELSEALKKRADGIGLFRTEFLFINRQNAPGEEEQFGIYRTALEKAQGKEVIIRTVDAGSDKPVNFLELPKETNPALGMRGIRVSISNPEIFRVQLRALFRAAGYGKLGILFPMVTSVKEIQTIKEQVKLAAQELTAHKKSFKIPKLGIMIETPAAALCSEELGKEVNFFSIGANDLTQYTLAWDRQNQGTELFCDFHNEAVYKLIAATVHGARANGITVGLCGELAADEKALPRLAELGLDEVSVGVATLGKSREIVAKAEEELKQEAKRKAKEKQKAEDQLEQHSETEPEQKQSTEDQPEQKPETEPEQKQSTEDQPEQVAKTVAAAKESISKKSEPKENSYKESLSGKDDTEDNDVEDNVLAAPADGRLLAMKDIPDVTFSKGIFDPCFGVYPADGLICAPIGGKIVNISQTGHAVVLQTAGGQQVMVHIGIDTAELQKGALEVMVTEGQMVHKGELLVKADLDAIRSPGYSPITIVALLKIGQKITKIS